MINLIGLKFKRNVNGLSDWTSTVLDVMVVGNIIDSGYFTITTDSIQVKSEKEIWYSLNEIVFVK